MNKMKKVLQEIEVGLEVDILSKYLKEASIPEWITKRKGLPQHSQHLSTDNTMKEIRNAQIKEEISCSLVYCGLFSEEHKGYRKRTEGRYDQLYLDQNIFKETKTRWKMSVLTKKGHDKTRKFG